MDSISKKSKDVEYEAGEKLASVVSSFMPYIEKKIAGLNLPGLESDDLRQEAFMALFSAIESFSEDRGAVFSTYAISCINNRLADAVRRSSSGKNRILNESVPFPEDDDIDDLFSGESPEETAILKEEYLRIRKKMDKVLSDLERECLIMYSSGYSYSEIAEKMDVAPKTVGNAIQRARKKLRQE